MFTVIENQYRPDGVVNQIVTNRQTSASAVSYYHDRFSKMAMTELYTEVRLILLDETLTVKDYDIVETSYSKPVPPVEVEPAEAE